VGSSDPEVIAQAYTDLEKANKAAYQSSYDIRRLQKELELVPTCYEADSITEAYLSRKADLGKIPSMAPSREREGKGRASAGVTGPNGSRHTTDGPGPRWQQPAQPKVGA
jgi:hypothetical protein